jgi:hypothetical protein
MVAVTSFITRSASSARSASTSSWLRTVSSRSEAAVSLRPFEGGRGAGIVSVIGAGRAACRKPPPLPPLRRQLRCLFSSASLLVRPRPPLPPAGGGHDEVGEVLDLPLLQARRQLRDRQLRLLEAAVAAVVAAERAARGAAATAAAAVRAGRRPCRRRAGALEERGCAARAAGSGLAARTRRSLRARRRVREGRGPMRQRAALSDLHAHAHASQPRPRPHLRAVEHQLDRHAARRRRAQRAQQQARVERVEQPRLGLLHADRQHDAHIAVGLDLDRVLRWSRRRGGGRRGRGVPPRADAPPARAASWRRALRARLPAAAPRRRTSSAYSSSERRSPCSCTMRSCADMAPASRSAARASRRAPLLPGRGARRRSAAAPAGSPDHGLAPRALIPAPWVPGALRFGCSERGCGLPICRGPASVSRPLYGFRSTVATRTPRQHPG